jgi:CubicO group peptidase (beta-lactamase class C family)
VTSTVDHLFTDWEHGPGGAVTVVLEGRTVHHQAYGLADVDAGVPFGTDQLFGMASVTKQFVAHLIVLLEQRGALRRDDPAHTHLPELGDLGATVTVEHLLRHRSGIRDHITLATLAGGRLLEGLTRESVRTMLLAQRSLDFPPGTAAVYSNSNYIVLSWIIERVTGRSLGEALTQYIFEPVGMTSTVVVEDPLRHPVSTPICGYEGTAPAGYRPWQLQTGYVAATAGSGARSTTWRAGSVTSTRRPATTAGRSTR